ncbi:PUTATIVE ZINC PROTEASE PROTEIN [hydrothermal vent metagenome]|uniref:PUTATIVE ZINC PROTEASE PROTEIN n=1 Tax=hydrothermal vent metagenome TaxID=652676 RepID=A0A3B0YV41_9ZZZZ
MNTLEKLLARLLSVIAFLCVVIQLSGCNDLRYYRQSVNGQLDIMDRRTSIKALVEDESMSPPLRQRLQRVTDFRTFAIEQLALPETGSYTFYADLERDYVIQNLFAAPEFSVDLHQWCYPVLGCAAYRGFFDTALLAVDAASFKEKGFDTYVALIPAYSTLGWFDDPVLNTVIEWPEPQLAGLIFHELAHQKLYVKGDTVFNESFATAVEQAGVELWLAQRNNPVLIGRYREQRDHRQQVIELIQQTRSRLKHLYEQTSEPAAMRIAKRKILDTARGGYRALREQWQHDPGFDAWFAGELNNARLGSVAAYHTYVDAFLSLLVEEQYDFEAFYARAEEIAGLDQDARQAYLQESPAR